MDVGALRGVVGSMLNLLDSGATHVGVATDHVVESFRNELYPGYRPAGHREAARAVRTARGGTRRARRRGVADGRVRGRRRAGLGGGGGGRGCARRSGADLHARQGSRAVRARSARGAVDRRRDLTRDGWASSTSSACRRHRSRTCWLVGDTADGFPSIPGWGMRSAAAILTRWAHVEKYPDDPAAWEMNPRGAARPRREPRAAARRRPAVQDLATLRTSAQVGDVDAWRWRGPKESFAALCKAAAQRMLARRAGEIAARARIASTHADRRTPPSARRSHRQAHLAHDLRSSDTGSAPASACFETARSPDRARRSRST